MRMVEGRGSLPEGGLRISTWRRSRWVMARIVLVEWPEAKEACDMLRSEGERESDGVSGYVGRGRLGGSSSTAEIARPFPLAEDTEWKGKSKD